MLKKQKPLSKLKKELWETFRHWVYKRDNYSCFTCGKTNLMGRDCQAGHFIKASVCGIELYFHPDNVKTQCSYCNGPLDGQQYLFGQKLGKKKVKYLEKLRLITKGSQWDRQKYEKMIKKYQLLPD